ncbi:hypothetical protein OEZ85_010799 [Tetradesmus obliquus]|uniref:Cyclic phosphodiesterase n=1 Tax=Tetradesmus obliquus TaxID=3088 RepID=A0ABY8TNN8_TETOB|nr:hypothetical protein OEZ85_010799 [Tetradesmus obliquus]
MSENYSIWIKPSGYMYNKLQQEIATQAKEYGAPLFEPHVTLLPDIQGDEEQIIATMQQLAQETKKFRINFLNVVQGSSFHKCVYILVAKEQAIMAAGAAAQQAFGKAPADYMPHLSLLYADVDDTARTASQQAAVQRLYGEGSDYKTLLTDNGFVAEAISLWYTPVEDRSLASWKQVAECPLS